MMQRVYITSGGSALRQMCSLCASTKYSSYKASCPRNSDDEMFTKIRYCQQLMLHRQPSRSFVTSQCLLREKTSHHFDDYYTAVTEATEENKRFQLLQEKHKQMEDLDEQARALRRWKFIEAVDFYIEQSGSSRRKHVEFILDALKQMKKYGVHRDLACYKALVKVFPEAVMVPQTKWQVEFMHFPKQQGCGIEIIEQMEDCGVCPDIEFGRLFLPVFGEHSHVIRKFRRTYYWAHKFVNKNPYKLPHDLPSDPIRLALLALKKMSVDLENEFQVWKLQDSSGVESSFIASAQSSTQRDMIAAHPEDTPLYVEGRFTVWLRDITQTYFILRADSDPKLFKKHLEDVDDLCNFDTIFDSEEPKEVMARLNDHQQEEGTILGMCITGTSSKDSLITWIRCLQENNPKLERIPIVFKLQSGEDSIVPVNVDNNQGQQVSKT